MRLTDAAVSDPSKDVFDLPCAYFRIDSADGWDAAEGAIGALEPANSTVMIAEAVLGKGDNTSQPIEPIRFEACQPTAAAPALQAARREIEGISQFFQSEAGRVHQPFDHGGRKPFTDGLAKIVLTPERPAQCAPAAQFPHYSAQFIDHLSQL